MGEMGLILDRYYKKQAILKKEQAKLSLKNELGIIFSAHPPTIPCFYLRLWPPGWAKVTEGKAKGAHTLPVPGQNGSRKCESSQKPPGDPVGVGAGFLVLEASSNGTSKSWAKLSRWCAPRWQDSVRLASRAVRRIWLPVHGASTTHKGSTTSHHDGDLHFHCESQNPSLASCVPGGWETPKPTLWAEQEETWNQYPWKRK